MNFAKIKVFVIGSFLLSSLKAGLITQEFLSDYRKIITKAELYCAQKDSDENLPLKDQQETLDSLYNYKNMFAQYLHDKEENLGDSDYIKVETTFYPLTKELIRHLEAHIENAYGRSERTTHFARIARSIFYTGLLTAAACGTVQILENNGILPKQTKDETVGLKGKIAMGGTALALLGILYDYSDKICGSREKVKVSY
jgi:hypothetical protein